MNKDKYLQLHQMFDSLLFKLEKPNATWNWQKSALKSRYDVFNKKQVRMLQFEFFLKF